MLLIEHLLFILTFWFGRFLSLPSQEFICSSEKKFSDQDLKINWSLNFPKPFTWIAKPLRSFLSLGFFFPSARLNRKQGWSYPVPRDCSSASSVYSYLKKKKKAGGKQHLEMLYFIMWDYYYCGNVSKQWAFFSLDRMLFAIIISHYPSSS